MGIGGLAVCGKELSIRHSCKSEDRRAILIDKLQNSSHLRRALRLDSMALGAMKNKYPSSRLAFQFVEAGPAFGRKCSLSSVQFHLLSLRGKRLCFAEVRVDVGKSVSCEEKTAGCDGQ
jgi:hypothetical protein